MCERDVLGQGCAALPRKALAQHCGPCSKLLSNAPPAKSSQNKSQARTYKLLKFTFMIKNYEMSQISTAKKK
jgi:hypothetical protein